MEIKRKYELIAEALEMEVDELGADTLLEDLESWDSLSKLALFVIMEDNFHKTLTSDDMKRFRSIQDILDCMG